MQRPEAQQFDKETGEWRQLVRIPSGAVELSGDLIIPPAARGVVLFAHGSGSSRHSPRNQQVAQVIRAEGCATLLFDLLTVGEEDVDLRTRHLRFDIELLAQRLVDAAQWVQNAEAALRQEADFQHLRVGFFGASTGGGAALFAAAHLGERVGAVVSRGGRPDLAGSALTQVTAPTLLLVGGYDTPVIAWNQEALAQLQCPKALQIIPGATHLFEEPGTLMAVAQTASAWFREYLQV
ncbi:MAG TPA: dienelactone hydrolase family protein [Blastocatellia bacterium]|nr:dienelactone hydrolase family protein [Blastocatellia bacterium]